MLLFLKAVVGLDGGRCRLHPIFCLRPNYHRMNNANIRLHAQKEYVAKLQRRLTAQLVAHANTPEAKEAAESKVGCFVVPIFTESGEQTEDVIRESITPTLSLVLVMSAIINTNAIRPRFIGALIFVPNSFLSTKYSAGTNIGGRIAIKYTYGKGLDRDIMYGAGTKIPCRRQDGLIIYRQHFWCPELSDQEKRKMTAEQIAAFEAKSVDDPAPVIANTEEIRKSQGNSEEKVIVMGNGHGGCIEADVDEPEEYSIIVRQGDRFAMLIGDINLMMETGLQAGDEIKNGRIVVKESFEPVDPDNPEYMIKRKNGLICRKDGKVIYSHSYFTYNRQDFDQIIKEDSPTVSIPLITK